METGTACGVRIDRGFFFISAPGMDDVFAHCRDLVGLEFDEQLMARRVRFDLVGTDRGPRAVNVQAAQ